MPRETLVEPWDFIPEDSEQEGFVSVVWQKDLEHVQVVTGNRVKVTHETTEEGRYVTLDRATINNLIRNLRRARDQAFGRDE